MNGRHALPYDAVAERRAMVAEASERIALDYWGKEQPKPRHRRCGPLCKACR